MVDMNDEEFIQGFEAGTLAGEGFHHREHVRIVWLYLRRYPLIETLKRFSDGLKRFATANGKPNLYHETITWAYVLLIHERVARNGSGQDWAQFSQTNTDLFDWKNNLLKSYYREETLRSPLARASFVFPDRLATGAAI